jgi:hypothetical protein
MKFYLIFHLNIFFSSISKKQRKEVINKCYWPLLMLVNNHKIPISIELSGLTLEIINKLDKKFIKKLKKLIKEGFVTLIGSGYSQIIGPLIEENINQNNLKIGKQIYKKILNENPTIALVNEQAFSKGLIKIYRKAGFEKIIVESNNFFSINKNFNNKLRYNSQYLSDDYNNSIEVIWNDSTMFQQFQRFVHGEFSEKKYFSFIKNYTKNQKGYLSLYGNDVEIFNFRPGRHKEEKKIINDEWKKIENLLLKISKKFQIININQIFNKKKKKLKSNNFENSIYVKKQNKYNITRWAVTGRNDTYINSLLHKKFEDSNIQKKNIKKLLYLLSSDFRTHITQERWNDFKKFFYKKKLSFSKKKLTKLKLKRFSFDNFQYENKKFIINLDVTKGLTIDKLIDKRDKNFSYINTLKQGEFRDINYLVDFFSSHLVIESKKYGKITNLNEQLSGYHEENDYIYLNNKIKAFEYNIQKSIKIYKNKKTIELRCEVKTNLFNDIKILRPFHFTLAPPAGKELLNILIANGGSVEKYKINEKDNFTQSAQVNNFISATTLSGMTNNIIEFKYKNKFLKFTDLLEDTKLYPMVDYVNVGKKKLFRLIFTVKENDETSKINELKELSCAVKIDF